MRLREAAPWVEALGKSTELALRVALDLPASPPYPKKGQSAG